MIQDVKNIFRSFYPKERRLFFTALGILILSGFFAIGGFITQTTIITPAEGGEYTEAIVGQPVTINPILSSGNNADEDLTTVLFADLQTLAKSFATSSDGSVWSVILKENIKWSDGQPITTDDIIYTITTIQDITSGSPLSNQWKGIIAERRSEREVVFTLKSGYSFFDETLYRLRISPKHIFGIIPAANLRLSNYNLEPIGSGPYKFVSFQKEKSGFISQYNLAINPHFPGTQALIPKITFRFFPNYSDAVISFNQKEVDGLGGLDSSSASEIKIAHTSYNLPINQYYAIFFNETVNPLLQDSTLRRALNLATNKELILSQSLGKNGRVTQGPLPEYSTSYHRNLLSGSSFSLAQAQSILEEAGWLVSDEDGIRTKNDQKLIVEITVPDLPFLTAAATQIKSDWEDLNVLTLLNIVPASIISDQHIASRSYQVLLFGNLSRGSEDIYSFWHSSERFHPGKNLSLYDNNLVGLLLEQNQKTFDQSLKTQNLLTVQEYIFEDTPAIFLFSPDYLYISSKTLGGFSDQAITKGMERLNSISQWFLKTDRVLK